ncbi:hypothetical protein AVEN_238615-1 [Araneus ventricosus]|uniref:DUF4817 domain-containing protein n=1 Tax=Araneus ventricosus TaxID=182803 RepID=A0A4Y2Q036_ARAVE|nr:hypothetical protein AVEN_238615-1 [Araneus ventricosus]
MPVKKTLLNISTAVCTFKQLFNVRRMSRQVRRRGMAGSTLQHRGSTEYAACSEQLSPFVLSLRLGRGCPVLRPPHSPDLHRWIFFLWGHLKELRCIET